MAHKKFTHNKGQWNIIGCNYYKKYRHLLYHHRSFYPGGGVWVVISMIPWRWTADRQTCSLTSYRWNTDEIYKM